MINLILGVPGSGKSYEAVVYHIIPAIEEGRRVVTNLPLNLDHFRQVFPDFYQLLEVVPSSAANPIPFARITDYGSDWRHPETDIGPLYVIDECHKALPRGATERAVEEWFAEHRHELADVLLITQSYGKISKSVCDLVHLVYRVRKNTALGSSDSYIRKVQDGIRGEVVNTAVRKYRPEFFPFYKSHTKSSSAAAEAAAADVKPIWRHWSFYGAALFLGLGIFLFAGAKSPMKPEAPHPATVPVSPVVASRIPLQQAPALPDHPFYKVSLHISGSMAIATGPITRYVYTIMLSQNGQHVGDITDRELLQAGYQVETFGPCMIKLSFRHSFADYITCDAPKERLNPDMPGAGSDTEGGPRARGVASVDEPVPGHS